MKTKTWLLAGALVAPAFGQSLHWTIEAQMTSWPDAWEDRLQDQPFFGSVSVLENSLSGRGEEQLFFSTTDLSFSLAIDFDQVTYQAIDDPSTGYPILNFSDGELTSIDFAIVLDPHRYAEGSLLQFHPDQMINYSPDGVGEYEGTYQIFTSIPEPSSTALLILSSLTIFTRKRS